MQHSPSREANSSSSSQEIPRIFWNPILYHRCNKQPASYPYAEPAESNPRPFVLFLGDPLKCHRPI